MPMFVEVVTRANHARDLQHVEQPLLPLRETLPALPSGLGVHHGGDVSSVRVCGPPPPPAPRPTPPPSFPPGPLSYQGSIAAGHTYGGAEGARNFFHLPSSTPPRPNTVTPSQPSAYS